MIRDYDIAIIGAGIAGASLAYRLLGQRSVILLEREDIAGFHATGRSTFTFVESYGGPLIRRLTSASRTFYEAPPDGFSDTPLFQSRGNLKLSRPGDEVRLDDLHADAGQHIDDLELLSISEARSLCPAINADAFTRALFEPRAADMDVNAIHRGFLKGTSLKTKAEVEHLEHKGDRWVIHLADGQTIRADIIVNAAGAWSGMVGTLAGATSVPLQPRRRSVFTFVPDKVDDFDRWPLVRDVPETFYFKPSAGALLATPANQTPSPPCDAQPEELDIAIGIDRLEKATDLRPGHLTSKWAGLRTFSPDEIPVIGFDPQAPGFFWLTGQGGYGIQTAPALSALAAGLLLERPPPDGMVSAWLNTLSPLRFIKT